MPKAIYETTVDITWERCIETRYFYGPGTKVLRVLGPGASPDLIDNVTGLYAILVNPQGGQLEKNATKVHKIVVDVEAGREEEVWVQKTKSNRRRFRRRKDAHKMC